jgi:c-di-GMP-binding flagellar brake protein YcgR
MNEPEILKSEELRDALGLVVEKKLTAVMSYFARGKWHMTNVSLCTLTSNTLHVEITPEETPRQVNVQINQPVGISIQHDFNKYIFETLVAGLETSVSQARGGKIILEVPDRMERMQRRAYTRMPVPKSLNVKVLFWHRGYADESREVPLENYWQGKLINLSAGGLQIGVDLNQRPNFRVGQLVGIQFTPMAYQKPIHVEGQVRHIAENAEGNVFYVGVEFLGLEASGQGRQKLRRIANTVNDYQTKNELQGEDSAVALAPPETEETISPFGTSESEEAEGPVDVSSIAKQM